LLLHSHEEIDEAVGSVGQVEFGKAAPTGLGE
jgi:hypothetical protein